MTSAADLVTLAPLYLETVGLLNLTIFDFDFNFLKLQVKQQLLEKLKNNG